MSTNFLQWNSTLANQETDAAYAGDALRVGGAPLDGIFPSATANKLFYQATTMVVALAEFIVAQGFNANDAVLATLLANLTNALIAIARKAVFSLIAVPFSATPVFDASQGNTFAITLTGNVTSSSLVNMSNGQIVNFIIHQDATGGRTMAWIGDPIDPAPNATSIQSFIRDEAGIIRPCSAMVVS